MESSADLGRWLVIWMVVVATILLLGWRRRTLSAGLIAAYLTNLWLIHWPAAAIYLLPWYSTYNDNFVKVGFQQSMYGVVGFGCGAIFLPMLLRHTAHSNRVKLAPQEPPTRGSDQRLPYMYMLVGLVSYLVVFPISGRIPTLTALTSAANQLVVVGLCLACWQAWIRRDRRTFTIWMFVSAGLPFATLLTQGFLGYGVASLIIVMAFVTRFFRPRWVVITTGLLVAYIGLSLYVTYMRDRGLIRNTVWGAQSLGARIEQIYASASDFEWFDIRSQAHLGRIDDRLNQNILVGAAVEYVSRSYEGFAAGSTLWQAALSLIPRAIWLEKPVYGGSPELVATYTGITFAYGTSVGIGQVMEFYINFGTAGVIVGFAILGGLIGLFDAAAAERLMRGDWRGSTMWFLPGLGFLQVGGSLVEVTSTVGASIAAILLMDRYLVPLLLKRQPRSPSRLLWRVRISQR